MRADSAGANQALDVHCREAGNGFSFGYPVDRGYVAIAHVIGDQLWQPAVDHDGGVRDGA